jgi:hypothetical protein
MLAGLLTLAGLLCHFSLMLSASAAPGALFPHSFAAGASDAGLRPMFHPVFSFGDGSLFPQEFSGILGISSSTLEITHPLSSLIEGNNGRQQG